MAQRADDEEKTMILNAEERERFAEYLEQDATTTEGLIRQMETMATDPVMAALIKQRRVEMLAERVVAKMLRQSTNV